MIPAALYVYSPPEDLRPAQVHYLRGYAEAHGWTVADSVLQGQLHIVLLQ